MSKNNFSNIGYEYGVKPFLMLASNTEFSNLFLKAKCNGMLYKFKKENSEMIPVRMSFWFENEKLGEEFFEILLGWVEKSNNDGDAVAIDFIENDKGGYTLCISPEMNRFIERMIPQDFKNKVTPIAMIQSHYKEIDTLGPNYLNFKSNFKKTDKIEVGYAIGPQTGIEKEGKKYFTKKEFNFFKQGSIPSDTMASGYGAKQGRSEFDPGTLPKPTKESIEEISKRRISEMKSLLPLTYNKLNNHWLGESQRKLSVKYDLEIIKQAISNLTIFERLKLSKELSPEFTMPGYPNRILEYLLSTYESFDSYYPTDDFYTEKRIVQQIENDKKELENYLSK